MKFYSYQIAKEEKVGEETRLVFSGVMKQVSPETLEIVKREAYNDEYTIVEIQETADEVRAMRDKLLADTDWTQVLDAPIDTETREAYRAYRQALRDIPEQEGFPETIVWPELPAKTKADPDPVDDAVDLLLSGATGEEAAT